MRICDDLALVLSGGSYRSMFEAYPVLLLQQLGIYPREIHAISGGVPNALGFVLGKADRLVEAWFAVRPEKLFAIDYWLLLAEPLKKKRLPVLGASSIFNTKALDEVMDREIDYEAALRSPITIRVGVADLLSGTPAIWFSNKDEGMTREFFRAVVLSSMRIPVFFPPVECSFRGKNYQLVDAGGITNVPVKRAINAGFSKIIVIETIPKEFLPVPRLDTIAECDLRYSEMKHLDETEGHLKWISFINQDLKALEGIEKAIADSRVPGEVREKILQARENFMFYGKRKIDICRVTPPSALDIFQKYRRKDYGTPTLKARFELVGAGAAAAEEILFPFLEEHGLLPDGADVASALAAIRKPPPPPITPKRKKSASQTSKFKKFSLFSALLTLYYMLRRRKRRSEH